MWDKAILGQFFALAPHFDSLKLLKPRLRTSAADRTGECTSPSLLGGGEATISCVVSGVIWFQVFGCIRDLCSWSAIRVGFVSCIASLRTARLPLPSDCENEARDGRGRLGRDSLFFLSKIQAVFLCKSRPSLCEDGVCQFSARLRRMSSDSKRSKPLLIFGFVALRSARLRWNRGRISCRM